MGVQQLDQYEQELGFVPVWVEIETAIHKNRSLVQDQHKQTPCWTRRDLIVLEQSKTEIIFNKKQVK